MSTDPSLRSARILVLIFSALALCVLGGAPVAHAQDTWQVDSVGDDGDATHGDGTCATSGGACTLRAAIEESNADGDMDTVEFGSIPTTSGSATIAVGSELQIDEPLFVNGKTAPNYSVSGPPIVILDGSSISSGSDDGLQVNGPADGTAIDALDIVNFPGHGVHILDADNVRVAYAYIGIDVDGSTAQGNGADGIRIDASGVLVGQRGRTGRRNVIAGNAGDGVHVRGSNAANTDVGSNYIGISADGGSAVPNGGAGVTVVDGTGHRIGYLTSTPFGTFNDGNVISGNDGAGIALTGGTTTVIANFVGTAADGTSALSNDTGVVLESNGNTIGPSSSGSDRNIISGNAFNGIRVGNGGTSVSADDNTIQNNFIGVDENGFGALGNGQGNQAGVQIDLGVGNTITGNVIGANDRYGVWIRVGGSASNEIMANLIGASPAGADVGNVSHGVFIEADGGAFSSANAVGGPNSGDGNTIGFNGRSGVFLSGRYVTVYRNHIGTDENGGDLGNGFAGVAVSGADVEVGAGGSNGNVIGFNSDGVRINDAARVTVEGNYIGTNADGNDLKNNDNGVQATASSGNSVSDIEVGHSYGTSVPADPSPGAGAAGNVIAFNGNGIDIAGTGATGVSARGNRMYSNGALGIDLGGDGITANDAGDGDSGPNNLQNTPEIDQNQTEYNTSTGEVEVRYRVRCSTTNCDYGSTGLKIDIYLADSETSGQGQTYLQTDEYPSSSASSYRFVSFAPPSGVTVSRSDFIVATATDAGNNTSEFSPPPATQLPVELAAFEATQSGEEAVQLRWTTASETDNAGFAVQRRTGDADAVDSGSDGDAWEKVAFVESKAEGGTSNEARTYRFQINDLGIGTHQFRLKQRDLDGTTHLHDPVTVVLRMQEALRLDAPAPNPVRTQATLSFGVKNPVEARMTLYNVLGKKVRTIYQGTPRPGEEQIVRIKTDGLSSGVYFLRLQSGGHAKIQRLVVVR